MYAMTAAKKFASHAGNETDAAEFIVFAAARPGCRQKQSTPGGQTLLHGTGLQNQLRKYGRDKGCEMSHELPQMDTKFLARIYRILFNHGLRGRIRIRPP